MRRGNYRLPVNRSRQQVGCVRIVGLRTSEPLKFLASAQLTLLHVRPGGKGAATATNDGDLGVGIGVETPQNLSQPPHLVIVERIEFIGTVKRNRCDPIFPFIQNRIASITVGHFCSPLSATRASNWMSH